MLDRTGYVFTCAEYLLAANAVIAAAVLPSRVSRVVFRVNFIAAGAFACGSIGSWTSQSLAEFLLQRIAQSPRNDLFSAEMLANVGRACVTLGAAGYGASLGNRFAKLIWWR